MKMIKKIVSVCAVLALSASVFAQNQNVQKNKESSVESEYLNDVDSEIIMSLAESDEYDNKLVALQYLTNALNDGNTSEGVIKALDKLAGEGLTNQSRTNGRLMNNYPDIRREACLLMSKVPTEHSKNTLVNIAVADGEPMVVAAAVHSLADIGINDNDEVVEAIAFANRRNEVLNPTSSLALETLNAFEILADSTENKKTMIDSIARIASDYRYVTPVRQKAYKLLKSMTGQSSDNKKSTSSKKANSDEVEDVR